jgi:hypothetical protein
MVRDVLAPALRAAGIRGSGQRFDASDEVSWAIIGLQKSRWNSGADVRFTVNLFVADRADWEAARTARPGLPAIPTANTRYSTGTSTRIGRLLPAGEDLWWVLQPGVDATALGREVADAILGVGMMWIGEQRGLLSHAAAGPG